MSEDLFDAILDFNGDPGIDFVKGIFNCDLITEESGKSDGPGNCDGEDGEDGEGDAYEDYEDYTQYGWRDDVEDEDRMLIDPYYYETAGEYYEDLETAREFKQI